MYLFFKNLIKPLLVHFKYFQDHKCHWINNTCYIAGYAQSKGVIAILDLNSLTLTPTFHTFYSDGQIIDVYSDGGNILSLCVWNGPDDVREIHRFCLK
jgi:hypothetical protein